jgi:AmmeMemoRadiSam system protein A
MSFLSDSDQKLLLGFARSTILAKLENTLNVKTPQSECDAFSQKRGCFVTLHKEGVLRGCIGTIEPITQLARCIEENALNAAFHDSRFSPLTKDELDAVKIEISILAVPQKLVFDSKDDLLRQLKPHVHGVILSHDWHKATFLPQVWEQLPDKRSFLEHLCRKAGLKELCWKEEQTEVAVYEVEYFSEEVN